MSRTRKRIEIGTAQPVGAASDGPAIPPRPGDRAWYFVTGHHRPVYLTGQEGYIRKWPDGTLMQAKGRTDTLRDAEARHKRPAKTEQEATDG